MWVGRSDELIYFPKLYATGIGTRLLDFKFLASFHYTNLKLHLVFWIGYHFVSNKARQWYDTKPMQSERCTWNFWDEDKELREFNTHRLKWIQEEQGKQEITYPMYLIEWVAQEEQKHGKW